MLNNLYKMFCAKQCASASPPTSVSQNLQSPTLFKFQLWTTRMMCCIVCHLGKLILQLVHTLYSCNRFEEYHNHRDVITTTPFNSLRCQPLRNHARLFHRVFDEGHNVVIRHGLPEAVTCDYLSKQISPSKQIKVGKISLKN